MWSLGTRIVAIIVSLSITGKGGGVKLVGRIKVNLFHPILLRYTEIFSSALLISERARTRIACARLILERVRTRISKIPLPLESRICPVPRTYVLMLWNRLLTFWARGARRRRALARRCAPTGSDQSKGARRPRGENLVNILL